MSGRWGVVIAVALVASGCAEPRKVARRDEPELDWSEDVRPRRREPPREERPVERAEPPPRIVAIATDPARAALVVTERGEGSGADACEIPLRAIETVTKRAELEATEAKLLRDLFLVFTKLSSEPRFEIAPLNQDELLRAVEGARPPRKLVVAVKRRWSPLPGSAVKEAELARLAVAVDRLRTRVHEGAGPDSTLCLELSGLAAARPLLELPAAPFELRVSGAAVAAAGFRPIDRDRDGVLAIESSNGVALTSRRFPVAAPVRVRRGGAAGCTWSLVARAGETEWTTVPTEVELPKGPDLLKSIAARIHVSAPGRPLRARPLTAGLAANGGGR